MRNFSAKFLIFPFIAFNTLAANANIYKYTFTYTDNNPVGSDDRVPGNLSGFMVIDTTLVGGSASEQAEYLNGSNSRVSIPNWVTQLELTLTPTAGSHLSSQTRTLTSTDPLTEWKWDPTGTFNPTSEFVGQMTRFSLDNGVNFTTSSSMIQQFDFDDAGGSPRGGEFLLNSPVNPVQVPGPLPLLGLAPLAYYFRKLKRTLKKN